MLRSILYAIGLCAGTIFYVLWALVLARAAPGRLLRHVEGWGRLHDRLSRRLLGIHARVEGVLPAEPVLVAMKHQAMYETLQVLILLDRPAVVLKRELADIPLFGRVVRAHGAIPIERTGGGKALRAMQAAARAAVAAGRPVLIFPEGTRVAPGEAPPLKPGFAGLYRVLGLPVVPVACDSGLLWPRRGAKRPGTVTFRVGETIPPGLPREEVEARVHAAINALEGQSSGGAPA